jgi:integrase
MVRRTITFDPKNVSAGISSVPDRKVNPKFACPHLLVDRKSSLSKRRTNCILKIIRFTFRGSTSRTWQLAVLFRVADKILQRDCSAISRIYTVKLVRMHAADENGLPLSSCDENIEASPSAISVDRPKIQTEVPGTIFPIANTDQNHVSLIALDVLKRFHEERFRALLRQRATSATLMAVVLSCAMRWGFIEQGINPLSLVRVKGISRRQAEPRILAANEIQALIAAMSKEPYRTMVITALSTGLRCSELFALKWGDFNWNRLTILVQRAIVDGVVGDVKTKYSQSGLPLDPVLAEILFTWKRASEFGRETDWVFASPQKGGDFPLRSTSVLEKHVKPAAITAGLGNVGWHTFRHTYSSMLRQLGVDLKVQQELLRHADVRTTLNVYTQAISEHKRAAHSSVVRMVLPDAKAAAMSQLDISGHF